MGQASVPTLSVREESKEGFWEEVSSALSPERCILVSALVSALDQCHLKNIKKQIYKLGMIAYSFNPSIQEIRRGRRRRRRRRRNRRRKGRK